MTHTTTFIHLRQNDEAPQGGARYQDGHVTIEVQLTLGNVDLYVFPGKQVGKLIEALKTITNDLERITS